MIDTMTLQQAIAQNWLKIELQRVHHDPGTLSLVPTNGGKLRAILGGKPLLWYNPKTETVRLIDGSVYNRQLETLREPSGVIWWGTPFGHVLQKALRLQ